jgi:predicted nuclease of predicted toxin-antitoxin system
MKFLLDVNASGTLFDFLVASGHNVVCVSDVNSRMPDYEILAWAVGEGRVIVTTDSDFEQIIWLQERPHCGVLRLENLPRSQRMLLFQEVLANYAEDLEAGAVIIAMQRKIRIRRKAIES